MRYIIALVMSFGLFGVPVQAESVPLGQLLYDNHCTICHTSVVHVRDERLANSLSEVRRQVSRWQKLLALNWDDSQINAVLQYVNDTFYHFKRDVL